MHLDRISLRTIFLEKPCAFMKEPSGFGRPATTKRSFAGIPALARSLQPISSRALSKIFVRFWNRRIASRHLALTLRAFSKFFDHLLVERSNVVRLSAGDQA